MGESIFATCTVRPLGYSASFRGNNKPLNINVKNTFLWEMLARLASAAVMARCFRLQCCRVKREGFFILFFLFIFFSLFT